MAEKIIELIIAAFAITAIICIAVFAYMSLNSSNAPIVAPITSWVNEMATVIVIFIIVLVIGIILFLIYRSGYFSEGSP
jgi:hypothetical protein